MVNGMAKLVYGVGPIPSKGMIIGEAPGAEEEKQGRPFVGASGKVLQDALKRSGLSRADVYITNCFKERPEGNRNPTREELEDHLPILMEEMERVDPVAVLLLGSVALHHLYPEAHGITLERGKWHQRPWSRLYLPTFHPAAVLYDRSKEEAFFQDVREWAEAVTSWKRVDGLIRKPSWGQAEL